MGFLSWFKSDKPAAKPSPLPVPLPRTAARAAAPVVVPVVVPPSQPESGLREPEQDGAALHAFLAERVASAVQRFRSKIGDAAGMGDTRRLLDDLGRNIDGVIRRPPIAAQQALAACRDPAASLETILASFHQDPALTQALLKHANSPFYSTGSSVSSLTEAAQRVGLTGLNSVLMAAIVDGLLCRPGGEFGPMVQQVWTHMVRSAPAARRLARVAKVAPETAYTLGLLHDLGKLIVFDRLTVQRTAGRHTAKIPRDFLTALLAELHGPLGGLAALAWNLEPEAARAIAAHPRGPIRYRGERMSQVLAVAEWVDLTTMRGQARDYPAFWERASLDLDLDACREALGDA
ncbi:MAG: HDOD domain-containing protein [Gemmatimonadetes bacterium]|nr:HDOD domain-containing protein [Gemmatimonadota bacterium]